MVLVLGRIDGTLQEREAICALKDGDIAALEVLYGLHYRAAFRTAYGIVRSYDRAEDVTQQVFIESLPRSSDTTIGAPSGRGYTESRSTLASMQSNATGDMNRSRRQASLSRQASLLKTPLNCRRSRPPSVRPSGP